jgi:hypothetical protein
MALAMGSGEGLMLGAMSVDAQLVLRNLDAAVAVVGAAVASMR